MTSNNDFEDIFRDCTKKEKKDYLFSSYEHIKQQVTERSNSAANFWIGYKFNNHPERIIDLVFRVIKPFLEKGKLTLSAEEQYILLCSAYLHDLAKFFPCLRIDNFDEKSLTPSQIKKIEEFHAFDVFRLLMFHIFAQHKNALETKCFNLSGMIERHNLFEHFTDAEEKRRLIESIAIVCGLHKSLTLKDEEVMRERMNKFLTHDEKQEKADKRGEKNLSGGNFGTRDQILQNINRADIKINLLAALLKLGDCFDISEERINAKMIEDVKLGLSKEDDAKVLAKWYQFTIVKKIDVVHEDDGNVEIIIEYCIPPELKKDELHKLTFFRMLAEKDFEDLTYLKVIEYYLYQRDTILLDSNTFMDFLARKYEYVSIEEGGKLNDGARKMRNSTTITAKYRVRRDKKDGMIKNVIEYIDGALKEHEKPKVDTPVKSYKIFPGWENSPERLFPTSKGVLFVLSFFDRYPSELFSIDEIKKKTGLSFEQINIVCESLVGLGYLEQRDNTFRKEEFGKSGENLRQIVREYQRNPYNLKIKAWEIEKFGEFLPLENITKGELIQTDILGLDKILSDQVDTFKGGIRADKCILIKGAPGTGKTTFGIQLLLNKKDLNCLYLTFEEDLKQLEEDFNDFGWDLSNIKFITLAGTLSKKTTDNLTEQILRFLTKVIDDENPDILVVDTITRFREFVEEKDTRKVLSDFMSILKIRHITSFFIGEEIKDGYDFEEYLVDGIIKLEYRKGKRCLEIMKIRGQNFASGVHSYGICDKKEIEQRKLKDLGIKPGINVYPNIETYLVKGGG
ncbi:MAG: AAA family ATPase [Methanophagales archaeon]|nr:AAA family ATPase [Methanophagales archaeon]